jgi:hypothetical protein
MTVLRLSSLAAACGLLASVCCAQGQRLVAICPWTFEDGNRTSRDKAIETIHNVFEHNGYVILPQERMDRRFESIQPAVAFRRGVPVLEDLDRYARDVEADMVVFGRASWHTRSIWVGTGPKTVSTAMVDIYIYNARLGRLTYERHDSEGRSDEKESALKDIADVLITPLITVVSGGPATPREQRAVQIALGRALAPWVQRRSHYPYPRSL